MVITVTTMEAMIGMTMIRMTIGTIMDRHGLAMALVGPEFMWPPVMAPTKIHINATPQRMAGIHVPMATSVADPGPHSGRIVLRLGCLARGANLRTLDHVACDKHQIRN